MWDIKHKSGTLLFTTSDKSVADNRRTMGWVVEMKKLTVEKAQELIEQLSQGERSCREEYYLQALEAFVGCQWIACSDRMPDVGVEILVYGDMHPCAVGQVRTNCVMPALMNNEEDFFSTGDVQHGAVMKNVTRWRPL